MKVNQYYVGVTGCGTQGQNHLLTLTKVMLDSGILTRRLIKEGLDPSWGFLPSPPRTKSMTSHFCQ